MNATPCDFALKRLAFAECTVLSLGHTVPVRAQAARHKCPIVSAELRCFCDGRLSHRYSFIIRQHPRSLITASPAGSAVGDGQHRKGIVRPRYLSLRDSGHASVKTLQLLLMGPGHKSLENGCFERWALRSSCSRLKIVQRLLLCAR